MLRPIKKIVVIMVLTAVAAGFGFWLAFADQYTGGAGDGWDYVQSSDLQMTAPEIVFSSAENQVFRVGQLPFGYFVSQVLDTGGNSELGALSWTAETPAGTEITLQIAGSDDNSTWTAYLGPDGTSDTFFSSSGTSLPAGLDTKRYLKYKVYFSTTDLAFTPSINNIKVSFAGGTAEDDTDRAIVAVSANAFTIAGGALDACNVEPETKVVGVTEDCTVTFTTANAIPSTGTIVVTFPDGFDIGQTHGSAPTGTGMDGVFAAAVSGQVVTVTRSGGASSAAGVKTLTLTDIKNPDTIGEKGTYEIKTTRSDGNTIDEETEVAADTIVVGGTITVADVAPANLVAGDVGTATITFTAINPIPADGIIEITFPDSLASGFAFDSGAATAAASSTMGGTFSAVDAGNVMTVTRLNDDAQEPAGAQVITLTNVKNPEWIGSTGTYSIKTASNAGVSTGRIDQITTVTADDITAGVLADAGTVTVTSPTYIAGDNTQNYTVAITTANVIPLGGDIVVGFDADYDLTGTLAVVGTSSHTATVADSSDDLIITLAEQASAGADVSMIISGIKNPETTQTTSDFTVTTRNTAGVAIDTGTASGVTIDVVLTVTAPNGSEEWISRTAHNIEWTEGAGADDFNLVDIYYSLDSGASWKLIAGSAPNTGTYSWTLPFVSSNTATCKVKVETNNTGAITSDVSDSTFTIQVPDITITSPTSGNETWAVGSTQKITWTTTANLITHVKLEYSTDGGETYPNLIAASAPNGTSGGSYDWTVPSAISASVKIRATDASETAATLGGAAAAKVSADARFEDGSKTLELDVITDFAVGDAVTISGLYFTDFSASAADNLELEIYNDGYIYTVDDKTITVTSAAVSPQYRGGTAGDGWDYGESDAL